MSDLSVADLLSGDDGDKKPKPRAESKREKIEPPPPPTPAALDLRADLIRMVRRANAMHPRSLQVAIGPSEVGNPCDRSLGFAVRDRDGESLPVGGDSSDPVPAIVGTSVHAWLENAAHNDNFIEKSLTGMDRWKPERSLNMEVNGYGLSGSCDLYDADTSTVIDWKVVGPTSFRKYEREELPTQYRVQVQLYGLGYHQLGYEVKNVAIAVLPRNGPLRDLNLISFPFDQALAEAALMRLQLIDEANDWQGQKAKPSSDHCRWCPVPRDACPERVS